MVYETNKIKRIIEHKDTLIDEQAKFDIEWLLGCYNDYYVNSKEYEEKIGNYNKLLNKYYAVEDEKVTLKQTIIRLRRRNTLLKELYDESCKK